MSNVDKNKIATSGNEAASTEKKKRKAQGPRKPMPVYVFVSVDDNRKVNVTKVTKNAKDIAAWVAAGGVTDPNNQLITVEVPTTGGAEPTAAAGTTA